MANPERSPFIQGDLGPPYLFGPDIPRRTEPAITQELNSDQRSDDEREPRIPLYQRIQAVRAQVKAEEERREREEGNELALETRDSNSENLDQHFSGEEINGVQGPNRVLFNTGRTVPIYGLNDRQAVAGAQDAKSKSKPNKVSSLSQIAERQILKQLKEAVNGHKPSANYCCGGSVSITNFMACSPIVLRYDSTEDVGPGKIQFPLANKTNSTIDDLLSACRKNGSLERNQFSVDFNPHDYGILDAINQVLLPDFGGPLLQERKEHRGIVAKLVKFNVYSEQEGDSHAQVDYPDEVTQFGSLVVCLPSEHEGGQLRVSYKGHSTYFDWDEMDSHSIHWAACHNECEYEILPIVAGHQMLLIYNLYVVEQTGGVIHLSPTINPTLFPLYEGVKQMVEEPSFMKDGCILGFYCKYLYAHNNRRANDLLPYGLKGIDANLFAVFKAAGLEVTVCPMLNKERVPEWPSDLVSEHDSESGKHLKPRGERITAGNEFHPMKIHHRGGRIQGWWEEIEHLPLEWPLTKLKNVVWLNKPTAPGKEGWEVAVVNMKYRPRPNDLDRDEEADDDEESLAWHWSHTVIVAEIPKRSHRASAQDQTRVA